MSTTPIRVYRDLTGANKRCAGKTRRLLRERRSYMLNLIGSPSPGKTTLFEKMVEPLRDRLRPAVLEGGIETTWFEAMRFRLMVSGLSTMAHKVNKL